MTTLPNGELELKAALAAARAQIDVLEKRMAEQSGSEAAPGPPAKRPHIDPSMLEDFSSKISVGCLLNRRLA